MVDGSASEIDHYAVRDVRPTDLGPLFQLDHDCRVASGRIGPRDQDVESLRREWQLELDEDALVAEIAQLKHLREGTKRVAPGRDFGWRRPIPEFLEEAIAELVRQARLHRVADELGARALVEMHLVRS